MNTIENLFCSPVVKKCRDVVKYSHSEAVLVDNEELIGIVYEIDGRYKKYYLESGLENLANFICSSDKDKLITDMDDYAVFNTMGKYIDLAIKGTKIDSFIPILKKYQESTIDGKFKYKNP